MKHQEKAIVISFLISIFLSWVYFVPPTGHYRFGNNDDGYLEIGQQVASSGTFGYAPDQPTAYRMPLFPLICAASYSLFDQRGPLAIEILQRLMLLAGAGVFFYLVRASLGLGWAWLGLITLLINPFFYEHGQRFTLTAGSFLLTNCLLLSFSNLKNNTRIFSWFLFGGFLGLATLYRQSFLVITFVLLILFFFIHQKKILTVILVGFLITMSPWWLRNYHVFKDFTLACTGTSQLLATCYHEKALQDLNIAALGYYIPDQKPAWLSQTDEFEAVSQAKQRAFENLQKISLSQLAFILSLKFTKFFYPYCHVPSGHPGFVPLFVIGLIFLSSLAFFIFKTNWNWTTGWQNHQMVILCLVILISGLSLSVIFHSNPRVNYPFWPAQLYLSLIGLKSIKAHFQNQKKI